MKKGASTMNDIMSLLRCGRIKEFNEYRQKNNQLKIDLSRQNLGGLHLEEVNLSGTLLSGADMSKTILINANLEEADLSKSNLTNSILENAKLSRANLNGARERLVRCELSFGNNNRMQRDQHV
jgi:uncharacterized protein YjbI with pentapeptide repeats